MERANGSEQRSNDERENDIDLSERARAREQGQAQDGSRASENDHRKPREQRVIGERAKRREQRKALERMATLKSVKRALARKPGPPSSDDPVKELRRLVRVHKALTKASVSLTNMSSDKVSKATGESIPCLLPDDDRADLQAAAKRRKESAKKLESLMLRELKKLPIWTLFLSKVFGLGPVVGAYLAAEVDIRIAIKPSSLRMFLGLAVEGGHLVRRVRGQKNRFSSEMRTRIYQFMSALWKNAAKENVTTKYLLVWTDFKHRMGHSERVVDGKIVNGQGKTVSAKGFVHSTGWHKAADVFIYDLYKVWRAIEGLPVWSTYREEKLKAEHLGRPITDQAPRMLTVEQALLEIGDVGALPMAQAAE